MKRKYFLWSVLSIIMTAALSVGLTSCGGDDDDPAPVPSLKVSSTSVLVDPNGSSTGDVTVTAENTDWTVDVTSGREWLTAYKNGNRVAISAKENTGTSDRTGSMTIAATANASLSYSIAVVQRGTSAFITVNGSDSARHEFPGLFGSGKGIDFKQTFKIKSNVQWTLSGTPNWLNVSPTSGNGDVDLTIYPSSENDTDTSRTATLTLSAAGSSVTIEITQKGGRPYVSVTPANQVALYDCMCWEYTATSNANNFKWILLEESEYKRLTEKEIYDEIRNKETLKYANDYLSSTGYDSHNNRIKENTTYYLITLAYDGNDKEGALKTTIIKTPSYYDADRDAWVSVSNVRYNLSSGFQFDATKEGFCNTYHIIYGNLNRTYNRVVYAFEINYYLKNNRKHWLANNWQMEITTDYPNNHTFTYYTTDLVDYPICFAYGWGKFANGDLSSDLVGSHYDLSEENSVRRAAPLRVKETSEFTLIKRSEEEQLAKLLRK